MQTINNARRKEQFKKWLLNGSFNNIDNYSVDSCDNPVENIDYADDLIYEAISEIASKLGFEIQPVDDLTNSRLAEIRMTILEEIMEGYYKANHPFNN